MPTTTIIAGTVEDWIWLDSPGWSLNPNGKNYLARIKPNKHAPGGIERAFQKKGKPTGHFVVRELSAGDAIEIGATDTNKDGTVVKARLHAIVHDVTKSSIVYRVFPDAEKTFNAADAFVQNLPIDAGPVSTLHRQLQQNLQQQEVLKDQEQELRNQILTCIKGETQSADDHVGGTVIDVEKMVRQIAVETGIDPEVAAEVAKAETSLPLDRLTGGVAQKRVPANVNTPDEDDDEEELTPAQIAALKRIG